MNKIKNMNTTGKVKCLQCGALFKKERNWHVFCSTKCRVAHWQSEHWESKKIVDVERRLEEVEKKLGIDK